MNAKRYLLIGTVLALLALPALAVAKGTRPPEGTNYAATDGSSNAAMTQTDSDSNGKAEKVDLGVAIYKCGNNVPFQLNDNKIRRNGKYKYRGKAKNLAGQKFRLKVKGQFKNARKAVEKVTIKKGGCKKRIRVKLKRA